MAGIRKSERLIKVKATCGHEVLVALPPGELGQKGSERAYKAATNPCYQCKAKTHRDTSTQT